MRWNYQNMDYYQRKNTELIGCGTRDRYERQGNFNENKRKQKIQKQN